MIEQTKIESLIQKYIMGWSNYIPTFTPMTNMNHALDVEEALYKKGVAVLLRRCTGGSCGMINNGYAKDGDFFCNVIDERNGTRYKTVSNTPHKAICLSALKFAGVIKYSSIEGGEITYEG